MSEEKSPAMAWPGTRGLRLRAASAVMVVIDFRSAAVAFAAGDGLSGPAPARSRSAALRNLARSGILDLKGRPIRIDVLSPGPIHTSGLVELAEPDAARQRGLLD